MINELLKQTVILITVTDGRKLITWNYNKSHNGVDVRSIPNSAWLVSGK